MSRDFGDFQTPHLLVNEVIKCLLHKGKQWTRVLEPTCGRGNFIKGLLEIDNPPQEIQGIEIQDKHILSAQELVQRKEFPNITIKQANIFHLDLQADLTWDNKGPFLILGNPPWVTNAELSLLESENLPTKTNFKGFSGLGAMTGESNFDIAEYIWIKLIREFASENPTIALLCKTSVARNVLKFTYDAKVPVKEACIWEIDSKKNFGAAVDACLFYIDISLGFSCYEAQVYQNLNTTIPYTTMGIRNKQLVSNISINSGLAFIDGTCPLTWRQGLKHDAAAIFELTYSSSGHLCNKLGEIVQVEPEYVYPLLKSSDLGGKEKERPQRAVLVTQKRIGENTHHIKYDAPLLWDYLTSYQEICDSRKSSIYENQPPFAIFGIGDYSFAPYKVAISGMYKTLKFSVVGPINGCPVQFDDTCYFIACISAEQASFISSLLSHPLCTKFINSIVFWDNKRPITKRLLQRIDLKTLLKHVDGQAIIEQANTILRAMNITQKTLSIEWPQNLEDFLKDLSLTRKTQDSTKLAKTGEATQINLF